MNKIAFLTHPYHRGGVTKWMADAANEFASRNIQTYFISVNPSKEFISGKGRPLMIQMVDPFLLTVIAPKVNYTFEFGNEEYKSHIYSKAILKSLPAGIPIILSDDPAVWKAGSYLSDRNPIIGVLHSDDTHYYSLATTYHSQIALLIAVSERVRKKSLNLLPSHSENIPVIPCGIPLPEFKNIAPKASAILSILWVGRIEEKQKRVSDLVKIASQLKKEQFPFQLSIIGGGPDSEKIKYEIKANQLDDVVKMEGWLKSDQVNKKMKQADVLLMTSNFEGMSIAVMEALSNGCGIVSSQVSGAEDLIHNPLSKNCIWIFPIGEINEAIACLKKSKQVPREERIVNARTFAESVFSIEACVTALDSALQHVDSKKEKATLPPQLKILVSPFLAFLRLVKIKINCFAS